MPVPKPVRPLVLIVDDIPDVRAGLRFLLETDEFRVVEAGDAASAVAELDKRQVDVMLADLYMPGTVDGVALIDLVHRMPKRPTAIIAMSGAPHLAYRSSLQAARYVGADETLVKPISRDTLITTIRRLIGGGPTLKPA
jgi:CheY-like chemotaxis protein